MKRLTRTLSLMAIVAVLFNSCKKEDSASCSDGIMNGTETGIDCGGDCDPCTVAPTCTDGIQNGNETGVDCGGDCDPCTVAPTCTDGIQNGDETGVDCGGPDCAACPTCTDGIQNGDETGVDCGGPCPSCVNCPATVTDIDGFVYNVVQIGGQCWMQQSLMTTRYNDGAAIPLVTDGVEWLSQELADAYCYYDNNSNFIGVYGNLYNANAVMTNKLCPTGWHIPSDDEWKTLEMHLGMSQSEANAEGTIRGTDQGYQMIAPTVNPSANNSSGFTSLLGGKREADSFGSFESRTAIGYYWTSTASPTSIYSNYMRALYQSTGGIWRGRENGEYGYSCRCVKD